MKPLTSATFAEVLHSGVSPLRQAGIEDAPREARLLLREALRKTNASQSFDPQARVDIHIQREYVCLLALRCERRPMSQILGRRAFWRHDFEVTPDVLDPRPETETLVEHALAGTVTRVLDLGTGSGAILISVLSERDGATGLGVDVSEAALAVAQRNAKALGVAARSHFDLSDWFSAVEGRFDLIVSNPPYIARDEMKSLAPELAYEPRAALTDEADGLSAYRAIASDVTRHLMPGGRLLVEIGSAQGEAVCTLFASAGLTEIALILDIDGRDRVVSARSAP